MRTLITLGLIAAFASPAVAQVPTACDQASDLLRVVKTERYRLEGEATKNARAAARFLRKGENSLDKLIIRYADDDSIDSTKLALFAKAGKWIDRARTTGAMPADAAPVAGWNAWFEACMGAVDDFVGDAVAERDRLLTEAFRNKVTRRLDKGLNSYDAAAREPVALERARLTVVAVEQVTAAYRKAQKFCAKESSPSCPRGILVANQKFGYSGRSSITVFDMEWQITLRTRDGVFVGERTGRLSTPGRLLDRPLPMQVRRGDTLDALSLAGIPFGFGHRMDGVIVWSTSGGEIEVPLHIDQ